MERRFQRRGVALALAILLACCTCACALDPSLDISQYAHTTWKVREGFFKGITFAIAQTPDGYLWLGTDFGLLRFDGVRAIPWQPPAGERLPSGTIRRLLVTRDGTLWIGTTEGLASWKNGKLTQRPELAGQQVTALLEDLEGTIWVGTGKVSVSETPGRLCAIQGASVHCYGEDGRLGQEVFSLYEDARGNLWAGSAEGLWRWKPGPPKLYPMPNAVPEFIGLAEDANGVLLIKHARGPMPAREWESRAISSSERANLQFRNAAPRPQWRPMDRNPWPRPFAYSQWKNGCVQRDRRSLG